MEHRCAWQRRCVVELVTHTSRFEKAHAHANWHDHVDDTSVDLQIQLDLLLVEYCAGEVQADFAGTDLHDDLPRHMPTPRHALFPGPGLYDDRFAPAGFVGPPRKGC